MLKFYPGSATLIISSTLAIAGLACSSKPNLNSLNKTPKSIVPRPSAALVKPDVIETLQPVTPEVQPNQFDLAIDKAIAAYTISQSAQSADDWKLVAAKWQEALTLMQSVPADSHYQAIAQKKVAEYQRNINYAQQQIKISSNATPQLDSLPFSLPDQVIEHTQSVQQTQTVFRVPVQRRESGTPVINVTFNGTSQFEMIVDTGASSTVITQEIANQLRIVPVTTAKANTASDRGVEFLIGYVDSIEVGGIVANNLPVAIAPSSQLETGLLGHDFFNNYDITFKRDVIEFRPR
jgi:clan AA aspartic protease (TIGR02281 family)